MSSDQDKLLQIMRLLQVAPGAMPHKIKDAEEIAPLLKILLRVNIDPLVQPPTRKPVI